MSKGKILIVEDEPKVASFIQKGLEINEFLCVVAPDGESALKQVTRLEFDAIILDLNLPKLHGTEVCKRIRVQNNLVPILMLTAMGTISDKVAGFSSGADDYLVKPFEFEELLLRIRALLKRSHKQPVSNEVLKIADLELDTASKTVKRANKKIDLTAKEFLLLEYLMRNRDKVLSRADIAEKIWDITFDTGTNIIDLYIFYLRKKIDKDFSPKLIHTKVGMGYVLRNENG